MMGKSPTKAGRSGAVTAQSSSRASKGGDASPSSPATTEGQRQLLELPGSLAEIAAKLGTAKQVVHRWRRGEKIPGQAPRLRLRDVYGIPPDAWERLPVGTAAPTPAPPAPAPAPSKPPRPTPPAGPAPAPARSGKPTLDEVIAELNYLHELRREKDLVAAAKVRLSDSISKNLALKARLERDQELLDDRIVREHPAWRRIEDRLVAWAKAHGPEIARSLAETLAELA